MQLDPTRAAFPAAAILPGHADYDRARISFNGILDRRPAAIVPCATLEEVVAAVLVARSLGLPIAVRGGGHSVAGHSIIDGALVVSLAPMRDVRVDPEHRLAQAGGGALWDDVDAAAFGHGLAVPGGTFGDTGIGGLTLGGGIGWLMPVAGLTCDNLVEAQVVTAAGEVVVANLDSNPDLLWALRGGGGNFGIVTRFTYRLRPVELLFGGIIRYPAAAARAVLARVEEVIARQPSAMLPTLTLQSDPELGSLVKLSFAIVDGTDPGPFVDRLVRDLPVVAAATGPLTYLELQALAGRMPFGLRNYWKGHGLRTLDPDLFEEIARGIGGPDELGSSFVMFEGIVGAGRVEPEGRRLRPARGALERKCAGHLGGAG